MAQYRLFDVKSLELLPLEKRISDLSVKDNLPIISCESQDENLCRIADRICQAKERKASIVLMIGGHVIRSGVQRYIIDLMDKGFISCVAMNGSCVIHDYEFALIGKTTESVTEYIKDGRFGLWKETGRINDVVSDAYRNQMGIGEAVGREIQEGEFPHKEISVLAAGYRTGVPITVHVGIGYDIVHEHPNCDGAAWGATSYTDFLRFAGVVEGLEGGVVMNFGSAVMAPEVYLKALSMARNRARQEKRQIRRFASLVCDLRPLPEHYRFEAPKTDPDYFFRPWKTQLVRTVADGGESYYVQGAHSRTIPALWNALRQADGWNRF